MLKRLLIAVFVLGLIVTLSGVASSNEGPVLENKGEIIKRTADQITKPQVPGYTPPLQRRADPPTFSEVEETIFAPNPIGMKSGCDIQDWTDYDNTGGYYAWDWYGDDPWQLAMRFDVTPGNTHTVLGSDVRIYDWSVEVDQIFDNGDGTFDTTWIGPDLYIRVWTDASGLPGTMIYEEVFPSSYIQANLPAYNYFYYFPFTSAVEIPAGELTYHISIGVAGPPATYITFGSDDGLVSAVSGITGISIGSNSWWVNGCAKSVMDSASRTTAVWELITFSIMFPPISKNS